MKRIITGCLLLLALAAQAEEKRVYQTDAYGNVRYHKPSLVVKDDGRVVEVSPYGTPQPQKQQYQLKGDKIYPTDATGRIQANKPSYQVEKDGRLIQVSPYGAKLYGEQQYKVEGDKIYRTDKYGNKLGQAYEVKPPKTQDAKAQDGTDRKSGMR